MRLSRRELICAGVAAAFAVRSWNAGARAASRAVTIDFASLPPGTGWPGFACTGVANLYRRDGEGRLEAGSDVFPNDPRPVAFAVDRRFDEGRVTAVVTRTGAGAGVVLRRVGPSDYYAAVVDSEQGALVLLRRSGTQSVELARTPLAAIVVPLRLTLEASGLRPTALRATVVDETGRTVEAAGVDDHQPLQQAGDPGVLATARTLFPSERNEAFPALGNVHLLPYGVQEGQAFIQSPGGQAFVDVIRERSTAAFRTIGVESAAALGATVPSVLAATSGVAGGRPALRVATDVPARVSIDISDRPDLRGGVTIDAGSTGDFEAVVARVADAAPGRRVHWRPRARRQGREAAGPVRSFRAPPAAGDSSPVRVAVGACASQFGPVFDRLAELRPDVFVWQGDLNYPDTHGPLAQTLAGYAGIWRDFLANPRTAPILERTTFVAQRDDHDYGVQDARAETLSQIGLAPWDALLGDEPYGRFSAGLLEVWLLDQRRFKSAPDLPDTPDKTLLGAEQRAWLLRTLAASRAPFKVVCSPCTLAPARPENARDGNWSAGFTAERDVLLRHVNARVSGTTLFVTGDTHFTLVFDGDGLFEARACPLDIPVPNDITVSEPLAAQQLERRSGVAYADDRHGHLAVLDVRGEGDSASLTLSLVRPDGSRPYVRRFEEPIAASPEGSLRPRRHEERRDARRDRRGGVGRRPASHDRGRTRRATDGGAAGGLPLTGGRLALVALAGSAVAAAGAVLRRLTPGREDRQ